MGECQNFSRHFLKDQSWFTGNTDIAMAPGVQLFPVHCGNMFTILSSNKLVSLLFHHYDKKENPKHRGENQTVFGIRSHLFELNSSIWGICLHVSGKFANLANLPIRPQLIEETGQEVQQTSKEQTKMPGFMLNGPRPCTIFCFPLIHYA